MQDKLNTIGAWASILVLIATIILTFIKRRWIIEMVKRIIAWFAKIRGKIGFRYKLRRALLLMLKPNLSEIRTPKNSNQSEDF